MYIHVCTYIQHQSSSSRKCVAAAVRTSMLLAVLLCHSVYCLLYVHEYGLLLIAALVFTPRLPLYDD